MSFFQRFFSWIWPDGKSGAAGGSDENLQDIRQATDSYHSWLVMSPIVLPGREPNTVTFSRRHWKRQYFVLSLVRGQTTQEPNRYHLVCYAREDRKRPKGSIDLNTVTDLRKMSVPPDELLSTLSRKHLCEDCQQTSFDPQRRVLICDQLPFFSFEAEFGEARGRIYLLAADARQMLDWVRHLGNACGIPETDRAETSVVQPPTPILQGQFPSVNTARRRSGSLTAGNQQQQQQQQQQVGFVFDSAVDVDIYGVPTDAEEDRPYLCSDGHADSLYGNLLDTVDDTYGDLTKKDANETDLTNTCDDEVYGCVSAVSSAAVRDSVDSGAFVEPPPPTAPRQFLSQSSKSKAAGLTRASSTEYENLNQIAAIAAAAGAAGANDPGASDSEIYGNVFDSEIQM